MSKDEKPSEPKEEKPKVTNSFGKLKIKWENKESSGLWVAVIEEMENEVPKVSER